MVRIITTLACFLFAFAAAARADGPLLPPDRPVEEVIDHYIDARLRAEKVSPAPAATDAEILRRLTLDLAGRIPTTRELDEYLAQSDPAKKARLVDRLMSSPGFVRHMAQRFTVLMQSPDDTMRRRVNGGLRDYLRRCFAENRPWDRIFREVILPDQNDPKQKGAEEFLKSRIRELNQVTNEVSTTFFGVNVSCAQCHDHPLVPDWKQDHFYGMASFFNRTVENNGFLGEQDYGVVKYTPNGGKEKVAPVMFLTGKALDIPDYREPTKEEQQRERQEFEQAKKAKKAPPAPKVSLRGKLVDLALQPGQSQFFSKSIVNRLWHQFFGRGLVMPLDQMHSANPPSHPELLAWLARDMEGHGYDLKRLVRGIALSQAYARSSRWELGDRPAEELFAAALVRPLAPLQLGASLRLAAVDPEALPKDHDAFEREMESLERSGEGLARLFEQPGEGFEISVDEALLFSNSDQITRELLQGNGRLVARMMAAPAVEDRAELAVKAVLSRPAEPDELQAIAGYLQQRQDRAEAACQQVVWALMTSAEFRFNH